MIGPLLRVAASAAAARSLRNAAHDAATRAMLAMGAALAIGVGVVCLTCATRQRPGASWERSGVLEARSTSPSPAAGAADAFALPVCERAAPPRRAMACVPAARSPADRRPAGSQANVAMASARQSSIACSLTTCLFYSSGTEITTWKNPNRRFFSDSLPCLYFCCCDAGAWNGVRGNPCIMSK